MYSWLQKGFGNSSFTQESYRWSFCQRGDRKNPKALRRKLMSTKLRSLIKPPSIPINETARSELLPTAVMKAKKLWEEAEKVKIQSTATIFNISYACAKYDLPFSTHPKIVKLVERNGNPESTTLLSEKSCTENWGWKRYYILPLYGSSSGARCELSCQIYGWNYPFAIT